MDLSLRWKVDFQFERGQLSPNFSLLGLLTSMKVSFAFIKSKGYENWKDSNQVTLLIWSYMYTLYFYRKKFLNSISYSYIYACIYLHTYLCCKNWETRYRTKAWKNSWRAYNAKPPHLMWDTETTCHIRLELESRTPRLIPLYHTTSITPHKINQI